MRVIGFAIFAGVCCSTTAMAQAPQAPATEIVITAGGELNSPWVEKRTCGENGCRVLIYNTETLEIARVDGRLTSYFRLTGVGEEVARRVQDSN